MVCGVFGFLRQSSRAPFHINEGTSTSEPPFEVFNVWFFLEHGVDYFVSELNLGAKGRQSYVPVGAMMVC